jgi:putative transcriptional regulator
MGKMFDLLKEGLEEAIAYEKGVSKNVRVKKVRIDTAKVPNHPKEYLANDIKRIRSKLNCSQNMLAACLNVSLNTIQAWEQGTRRPSHAALRLLEIMDKGPKFLTSLTEISHQRHSRHSM